MSHTFTGPQGTTFIFNSDLSGMVMAFGVANFSGDAEIPGVDLVAFHEHVTKEEPVAKEGERRGLAELMANLEFWHPARRDYEAMKGLLEERYPAPSPEALEGLRAGIEQPQGATVPHEWKQYPLTPIAAPDRERIEFIRRAYLARLASHPDPTRVHVNTARGTLSGTDAFRHLAEQDWEAVKDLEAEPDGC